MNGKLARNMRKFVSTNTQYNISYNRLKDAVKRDPKFKNKILEMVKGLEAVKEVLEK